MAEFKISRFKYTWQGPWVAARRYNPDDVVAFGAKVYTCLESHTSNLDFYADLEYYNNDLPPLLSPKWELMADGASWLGNWTTETYYKRGDTVKNGGTTYICTVDHTSGELETSFADEAAHWSVQLNSTNWKIDWAPGVYYIVNDLVRYGGRTYICNTSHPSSGGFDDGLEINIDYWTLVAIGDDWRGNWTPNIRYKTNDIVKYGGIVYRCQVPHKSNVDESIGLHADFAKWAVLHSSTEHKGTWQLSTIYKVNDVVKYGSYLYICNTFHTSSIDFDFDKFDIFCPGAEYDVVWDSATVYQPGDVVRYGGNLYFANQDTLNQVPSTQALAWSLLFLNTRIRGQYDFTQTYQAGDVVRRGGNLYSAHSDNFDQDPDINEDGSTVNSEYWDLIIPGINWRGIWALGETYMSGDVVVWTSSSYKCLDKHVANNGNRPDDDSADSSQLGKFWTKITEGNRLNRMNNPGDLRTFDATEDGSTVGYTRVEVGEQGQALMATSGSVEWSELWDSNKIYFVATFGEDVPTAGTSPQSPWRTIKYATENITGYATIYVRTGVYEEVLPITIPAFVAVVGDELRSTVVKPAAAIVDETYLNLLSAAAAYMGTISQYVVQEGVIGTTNPLDESFETIIYGLVPQDFSGTAASELEGSAVKSLFDQIASTLATLNPVSVTSTNTFTVNANRINARLQLENNREFLKNEASLYVENVFTDSTVVDLPERFSKDLDKLIDAVYYDLGYLGNYKSTQAATFFINSCFADINAQQDMFRMRDGSGLRNMTLSGLRGTLGPLNTYLTRRPNAGAFVSLDPGWGPNDTTAWVGTKSPYIQNVTTFGDGCIGFKIDGDLHAGGNQTMVSNDFTQIISDGIGVWANGTGRTECVSVFTYYNHIGYLATNGGKIRGTNGNCSYGQYGAVSEGYNIAENPIQATVTNKFYDATVEQALCDAETGIMKLFFSNAGTEYTTANLSVVGSGIDASLVADEFRDGAVFEVRITDPGDSSAAGGSGYVFTTNAAQFGNDQTITIAGSDVNTPDTYRNMRIYLGSGTGSGQYGYVAEYNDTSKVAIVGLESKPTATVSTSSSATNQLGIGSTAHLEVDMPIAFTGTKFGNISDDTIYYVKTIVGSAITISDTQGGSTFGLINGTGDMTLHCVGWDHIVDGASIEPLLDTTSNYYIEPRVTFSSPGLTTISSTLPLSRKWSSVAASPDIYVATIYDSNTMGYSTTGTTWNTSTLPSNGFWTKVKWVNDRFIAFASEGEAIYSEDGISWSLLTMSSTAQWTDVAYGEGKYVAVAGGGTTAAYSTDGLSWTGVNLPEGADWNAVVYGKGKFVATALSDSATSGLAYSDDGVTWTAGTIGCGTIDLAYGNNRFVAIEGGFAGATNVATSTNGIDWTVGTLAAGDWRSITYGQGLFAAVAHDTANIAISKDGIVWEYNSIGSAPWSAVAFANVSKPGSFIAVAGLTENSTTAKLIKTGRTTQARAVVVAGRMASIKIWEPGSGYTSAPAITFTDPNNSADVNVDVRIGNGVIANPTIVNKGEGYTTTSTRVTVTGDGYKDEYQTGTELVVENLTRLPSPGDNISISSISDYTYKLLSVTVLSGALPNYTAKLIIAKDLGREESPDHGSSLIIRQLYSQVRLTGHDFLDIGLGTFLQTNYPDTLNPNGTVVSPENEVVESGGGRVFYTATDQDGNFRVGELFSVEQATGTVTLNAQFFELDGLEELRLGGVTIGGSGVVVREFSTDTTFTADSNNIVPTQKAIKAYLNRRVSGGGADAITGQLTAGVVKVGPDEISTTTGDVLIVDSRINFQGGIDGDWLVHSYFL